LQAAKVNNLFAYAYTLAGHEHFANDELDSALQLFQRAIECDSRHYNAWYGIGIVYRRQEKFEEAKLHFSKAIEINSQSSILYFYYGLVCNVDTRRFFSFLLILTRFHFDRHSMTRQNTMKQLQCLTRPLNSTTKI